MGEAVIEAAREAGHPDHPARRLLPARRASGGQPDEVQLRFGDGSAAAWAERVDGLRAGPGCAGSARRSTASARSTRRRRPSVAAWARERAAPLHAHVSEQPAENEDCLARARAHPGRAAGRSRARWTSASPRSTPPTSPRPTSACSARPAASVCLCPTTERDLADGIGPARRLADAGAALCLGSDSHAVIDLFEEARAVELDERLATGVRGHHPAAGLLRGGDRGRARGARLARGGPDRAGGAGRPGRPSGSTRVRLAGHGARARPRLGRVRRRRRRRPRRDRAAGARWSATAGTSRSTSPAELASSIGALRAMSTAGRSTTSACSSPTTPRSGEGPLGLVPRRGAGHRGRAGGRGRATPGAAADERIDAAGRCVIPGFVDSHTHLVFAGDRAEEFAARMAGQPYEAGGIRVTTEATRAASERGARAR